MTESQFLAWYALNETTGLRVDETVNGYDMTAVNTPGYSASGKQGNCLDLENTIRTNANCLKNAMIGPTGDFSFAGWYKFEQFGPYSEFFFGHYNNVGNQRGIYFLKNTESGINKLEVVISHDGTTTNFLQYRTDSDVVPLTATWYHIGMSLDISANVVKIYLNGSTTPVTKTINNGTVTAIHNSTADFYLGSRNNDGTYHYFDGLQDEVCMGEEVWSDADFSWLYNSGAGRTWADVGGDTVAQKSNFFAFMGS